MHSETSSIEYEKSPPQPAGEGIAWHVKHRSSYRLFSFPENGNDRELLHCTFFFEVHWLKLANYRRRNIDSLGIEYVKSGSLLAMQNGVKYRVMPGEVFLAQPYAENEFKTGPEGFCEKLSLSICGEVMRAFLRSSGLGMVNKMTEFDRTRFELLLERFKTLSAESPRAIRRSNGALCYELLHFLQFPKAENPIPERFERLGHYLNTHLSSPLNLEQLAEMAGYSQVHFIREFTRYFGTTPGKYIHSRRMATAAELLLNHPELSIKEIAAEIGYSNALNFSTAFRTCHTLSPRQYRNSGHIT